MSDRAVAFHNNPWQGVLYVTGGGGLERLKVPTQYHVPLLD